MGDFEPAMSFDDILDMDDAEVEKLLGEYELFKKERREFQKMALLKLPNNPPLLLDCIHFIRVNNGLEHEGIFRVNGDSHAVETLRNTFIQNVDLQDILLSLQQSMQLKTYDIATALKSYLRLLEDPLVPHEAYGRLKAILDSQGQNTINMFNEEIAKIKEPNKSILAFTMMFFQDIIAKSDVNKMGASNLATCLTMSIVRFKDTGTNHFAAMMEVGMSSKVIAMMLTDIDFTHFIKPDRYLEMLRATSYKRELLPNTLEEFMEHEQFARFKARYGRAIKPPVAPRRKKVAPPIPPKVATAEDIDDDIEV